MNWELLELSEKVIQNLGFNPGDKYGAYTSARKSVYTTLLENIPSLKLVEITTIEALKAEEITKVEDSIFIDWSREVEITRLIERFPKKPGVYCIHYDNEICLYAGKSINIRQRIQAHLTSRCSPVFQVRKLARHLSYQVIEDPQELDNLEVERIKELAPVLNIANNEENKRLRNQERLIHKLNDLERSYLLREVLPHRVYSTSTVCALINAVKSMQDETDRREIA